MAYYPYYITRMLCKECNINFVSFLFLFFQKELMITMHMKITKGVKKMQIDDDEITTVVSSDDDTASLNSNDGNEDNAVSKPQSPLNKLHVKDVSLKDMV